MNFPNQKENLSTAQLFSELTRELGSLLRNEVALAKTEAGEKMSQAGSGIALAAAGGLLAYAGLLVLLAGAVAGLAQIVPLWLSALIIGGAAVIAGVGLLQKGRSNLKPDNLALRHTSRTLNEEKELLREHYRG